MIQFLRDQGAIIYAKFISILKPNPSYGAWMADVFRRDYVETLGLDLNLIDANKLHITLAYVSLPMNYDADDEELYKIKAENILGIIAQNTTDAISAMRDTITETPITWDKIEPFGRFIGVSYLTPQPVKGLIDSLYRSIRSSGFPDAQETYPARLNLHISIAEMKEGKLDPKKKRIPSTGTIRLE